MPSSHVYLNSGLSLRPQFPNQAPPGAQQLSLLNCLKLPHLEHLGLGVVVILAVVSLAAGGNEWAHISIQILVTNYVMCRQASNTAELCYCTFTSGQALVPSVLKR